MFRTIKSAVTDTKLAKAYRLWRDQRKFAKRVYESCRLGFKFYGHLQMQEGIFEDEEIQIAKLLMKCSDVFVDIGANVGYYTCLACYEGCKAVLAVEPLPENLKYLYGNISSNEWENRVEVWPVGVSNHPSISTIYSEGTGASLIKGWAGSSELMRQTIAVNTIDNLMAARFLSGQIFVKIDIEGVEYDALQGGKSLLSRDIKPRWLVEITLSEHRKGALNERFLDTFTLFFDEGYLCYSIAGGLVKISEPDVKRYASGEQDSRFRTNFLFISKSDKDACSLIRPLINVA
jgi:FkbM family methyltransferase